MLRGKKWLFLLLPGLMGLLVFYVVPFIYSFYFSAVENAFSRKFIGISNFIEILGNKYFRLALKNTFLFTATAVPLLMIISFVLAVLLVSNSQRIGLFKTAFIVPILLPSASVVMIWQVLFSENGFIIQSIAQGLLGLSEKEITKIPIYAFFIWKNAGFNIILFMAGIMSIPKEIYEACDVEGAGFIRKHFQITFPLLLPTTFFVLIISIVNSFKIFKEVYLLYGSYPNESIYFVQHYMNNHFFKMNYQNLASGAIVFALIVYIIVVVGYKVENRLNKGVW